ncbi:MAG: gliding motility-associated ABC transporter permease subunit GldF [Bacteroidetes bacterium]|nr:gliding motility-associated ABC transporter permease subunit GldF [Bacteroidota bacterium]
MYTLYKKEILTFLNSLIGYIVVGVFLLFNGLMIWVLPFETNLLDYGYSTLDSLFIIAPWVYLFLIPAITMRSFADEKKAGTIEFLLTKPISELQIVLAKFFANVTLVVFSLLPTLIYFYSVYQLGNPKGNIDTGGMWGSYIGLLLLGAAYVSIGVFSSSITDNQIVAFIICICLCLVMCYGFETISAFEFLGKVDDFILSLGINEHYKSLSRGVVDTRDVIYFFSVIALFTLFTKTVLESRKW